MVASLLHFTRMAPDDFSSILYLRNGSPRQQEAYAALCGTGIMDLLKDYVPLLAGTIPLGIDVSGSDLDILCYASDAKRFTADLSQFFGHYESFELAQISTPHGLAITATFFAHGFVFEVFGQAVPSHRQPGYRHLLVEYKLLQAHGPDFRRKIIELKKSGLKTEPAFAQVLGLTGDPYQALLSLE